MAQQQLDFADVIAGFQKVGGKGVAKRVQAGTFVDPGLLPRFVVDLQNGSIAQRLARMGGGKEVALGPRHSVVLPQFFEEFFGKQGIAILTAFAVDDFD